MSFPPTVAKLRRNLCQFDKAIPWNPDQHIFNEFRCQPGKYRRLRRRGCYRVDCDCGLRKLFAQRFGEAQHASFRSTIGRNVWIAFFSGHR